MWTMRWVYTQWTTLDQDTMNGSMISKIRNDRSSERMNPKKEMWPKIEEDSTRQTRLKDEQKSTQLTRQWSIDISVVQETKTKLTWRMIDRYRCGPNSKTDMELTWKWPIDIGAVPTWKLKLIRRWPIDIGVVPTRKLTQNWYEDDRST